VSNLHLRGKWLEHGVTNDQWVDYRFFLAYSDLSARKPRLIYVLSAGDMEDRAYGYAGLH
jgi:hypothetical protein